MNVVIPSFFDVYEEKIFEYEERLKKLNLPSLIWSFFVQNRCLKHRSTHFYSTFKNLTCEVHTLHAFKLFTDSLEIKLVIFIHRYLERNCTILISFSWIHACEPYRTCYRLQRRGKF